MAKKLGDVTVAIAIANNLNSPQHFTMQAVTFYMPSHPEPHRFETIDPDENPDALQDGRDQWIPHTFMRLRKIGREVSIVNTAPDSGIVVVFAADLRQLLQDCPSRRDIVIVCAQADRRVPELLLADVVVQHNEADSLGVRSVHIPNWPQSGLIKRDSKRGNKLRNIAYKGSTINLASEYVGAEWDAYLRERGLEFRIETTEQDEGLRRCKARSNIRINTEMRWRDFSDTDLVLAVRPHSPDLHPHKPALKLVNAWHAGVPAVLGDEIGYRQVRRSTLDYMAVASLDEAMEAIDLLVAEADLYRAMISNGFTRAEEFTHEAIADRWEQLLFNDLQGFKPNRAIQLARPFVAPFVRAIRRVRRSLTGDPQRARL